MKISNYFFLAALATLFVLSACSKEDLKQTDSNEALQGYITLTVSNPPGARTTGTPTEPGLPAESVIDDVTVVFANSAGVIQHVATPSISSGTTDKFQISLGTYYVYALVNCPIATADLAATTNIDRVISGVTAQEASPGYKSGKFFMVNQHNPNTVHAGVQTTVSAANTVNNPAQATIYVDRVAAKIEDPTGYTANAPVITDLTAKTSLLDAVDITGFVLLNGNKQFNLLQQWNSANPNGALNPLADDNVLSTPLFPGGTELVSDQYFNNISTYTQLTKDAGTGNVTAMTDLTKDSPTITYGLGPVYTTENRPTLSFYGASNKITSGRGETTGVIYKVQAKISGANAPTFYKYREQVYATLTIINALPDFSGVDLSTYSIPQLRGLGIQVYENGVMYYTYFILDPNTTHQYNGSDYYGVFRNSVYKLKISSISDLGEDVPGGGTVDPSQPGEPGNPPIDKEEAYIQVSVTVNPWIINTIDIKF
ncbi:Mfa1 family fimbria major subunit [Limibacterium fermenti]|uniref:Mfa1 family fimbria major subunit n=1 Tax=Limibacterium fermenti TaxID=3229863 RepID=UPI000E9FF6C3|nr:hypothetical protein [Porphyromonadaceae bacterium]